MDDKMLFTKTMFIDSKGRVFLPTITDGKAGEKVFLWCSSTRDCIIVRDERCANRLLENFVSSNLVERDEKMKQFGSFFFNSIGSTQIDCRGRILLPVDVRVEVGILKSAFVVGCGDELRIYPNKEAALAGLVKPENNKVKKYN